MDTNRSKVLYLARQAVEQLDNLFAKTEYRGFDPYDGLNSDSMLARLLKTTAFSRLVLIHLNKRSIFNVRPVFGVNPQVNAKLLGLILSGRKKLDAEPPERFVDLILSLRSSLAKHNAWGYYFDWQSRVFFLPGNTPSVVVTSFVCQGLMDWCENSEDPLLDIVADAIRFISTELNQYRDETGRCLSYSPQDNSLIYNASLLGAETIARYQKLRDRKRSNT